MVAEFEREYAALQSNTAWRLLVADLEQRRETLRRSLEAGPEQDERNRGQLQMIRVVLEQPNTLLNDARTTAMRGEQ